MQGLALQADDLALKNNVLLSNPEKCKPNVIIQANGERYG
jgi:hypothetical protein